MSSQEEQVERRKKRDMLAQAGMDPYTAVSHATHTNTALLADFTALAEDKTEVTVVGRVMALRLHGGSAFADVFDGTARLQIFLSKDVVGETLYDLFASAIDAGDFIEATGVPFVTKRETLAVGVNSWRVLTKALQSIPAEHFGIKDEETKFRKRYLDILMDEELRTMFVRKAHFWDVTRNFMKSHGFLEVETPTIEVTTGGAEASLHGDHGA